MTVRVLLFASYAEALGTSELSLDVPVDSRVADVLDQLRGMAGAQALPPSPLVAVNASYAAAGQRLSAGDEVAVIPPVAGG
jgi:molybdopterin converting factor subunit 1